MTHPSLGERAACETIGCRNRAVVYLTCEGDGSYPYCDECATVLRAAGEDTCGSVDDPVEAENRRLLNIINVAAEYLRDPERDPAEGRALAALALDKAGEASDD